MPDAAPSGKDFWDKLDIFGKFLSGVVIGLATIMVAGVYHYEETLSRKAQSDIARDDQMAQDARAVEQNNYNSRTQRLSVINQLMPLIKNGNQDRKAALTLLSVYADRDVAVRIARIYGDPIVAAEIVESFSDPEAASQIASIYPNDPNVRKAADLAFARPDPAVPVVQSPPAAPSASGQPPPQAGIFTGYLYVGNYDAVKKKWITKYLDFDDSAAPPTLLNRTLSVRKETGDVNVRAVIPGRPRPASPVTRVLQPGEKVAVKEIGDVNNNGFFWGLVTGA